jgi:peptidoglycan/xylan/chitin deacetylase (PgdA/CDA1 family)
MAADGHELGNHLFRDEPSIKLSPEEFERQLLDADAGEAARRLFTRSRLK